MTIFYFYKTFEYMKLGGSTGILFLNLTGASKKKHSKVKKDSNL